MVVTEFMNNKLKESKIENLEKKALLVNGYRKKSSLLKRTASEPKLSKLDSEGNIDQNSNKEEENKEMPNISTIKTDNNFNKTQHNTKTPSIPRLQVNSGDKEKESTSGLDSAFNEIYFYNFENVLIDFIKKKYSK
jgi:hypothetical protein